MSKGISNNYICSKEYLSEEDYMEVKKLSEICTSNDNVNLKIELDYKLSEGKNHKSDSKNANEFLYYADEQLVGYIGISCFGGNVGEINGMVHPGYRRQGIFKELFKQVMDECEKRHFNEVLLLTDEKSTTGIEFIKSVGGTYKVSEYRMELINKSIRESNEVVTLRKSNKFDNSEIAREDSLFFEDEDPDAIDDTENKSEESLLEELNSENTIIYMIEKDGVIIGKINLEFDEDSAFIFGFGILEEFRGRGYGKAALINALYLINEKGINRAGLDVACNNKRALNLYESCGFSEKSVMNYYNI